SLGATLYFLLTGKNPPSAPDREDGIAKLSIPSNVSEDIATAIREAMRLAKEERPQTIYDFMSLLPGGMPPEPSIEKEDLEQMYSIHHDLDDPQSPLPDEIPAEPRMEEVEEEIISFPKDEAEPHEKKDVAKALTPIVPKEEPKKPERPAQPKPPVVKKRRGFFSKLSEWRNHLFALLFVVVFFFVIIPFVDKIADLIFSVQTDPAQQPVAPIGADTLTMDSLAERTVVAPVVEPKSVPTVESKPTTTVESKPAVAAESKPATTVESKPATTTESKSTGPTGPRPKFPLSKEEARVVFDRSGLRTVAQEIRVPQMVRVQGGDIVYSDTTIHVEDFYIGKFEVTQGEWESIMNSNPSYFKKGDDYPVEQVSMKDIQEYIRELNEFTDMQYRLPTYHEWRFAARERYVNRRYKYSGSDKIDDVGWYEGNSGDTTHPVGKKSPNALGLYDMTGNVGEFVSILPYSSNYREMGGRYDYPEKFCGVDIVHGGIAGAYKKVGFRLALSSSAAHD
ncbi:MAG: SUMF1/EgtB/PvdO family nonheme iron enzyme, partial [Mediterranea sp.]|nr:SUMF1/EgtB/PvdO family nonheme iron enzyme [Mediterranea sp.]